MKKKIIRLTGILLALVVLLTSGSVTVLADEIGAADDKESKSVNEEHGMGYREFPDEPVPDSISVYSSDRSLRLRNTYVFSNDTASATDRKYPENFSDFDSYMPPLRDQNPYGSCWAHSAMALAEINLRKTGKDVFGSGSVGGSACLFCI